MSPLKVGDKVRTATALKASHWTQNELACRRPGAEGVIVRTFETSPSLAVANMRGPIVTFCHICRDHGCYAVEHTLGCVAFYHGDELTVVTQAEPEPDDEPDGGRLGERVEGLAVAVQRLEAKLRLAHIRLGTTARTGLSGQLDALRGRVAALEHPPAPEPVDPSAAVDAADSWWCRELADALRVPVADGNELLHRLRARLEAYRALHGAAADWRLYADDDDATDGESAEQGLRAALHVLDQLGVTPDKPPAAVHDDSSLDPARCERCGILTQMLDETTNTLFGIRQELLDAVDGEPEATTDELLTRVLRRAGVVQHLIETNDAKKMRRAADGMGSLADRGGIARSIAALLNEAADIFDDELATAGGED